MKIGKHSNEQAKKQISIEAMLYGLAETSTSISIVVLTYFNIVVQTCCRIEMQKHLFIETKKQSNISVMIYR
jgi:tryptophan synthase alpha subunit